MDMKQEYWLPHRPADIRDESDYRVDRITESQVWPADFLTNPEEYLYDTHMYGGKAEAKILLSVQGKPDAMVKIYRGAPSGGQLNTGDWVTLSKAYAKVYAGNGAYSTNPNSKVYEYLVRADELSFDGDSMHEYGYWGKPISGTTVA